jgi:hypothetical protein
VARSSRQDQFHIGADFLESLYQQVTVLLGRKPAEKKNVIVGREVPIAQPPDRTALDRRGPIGHEDGFALVTVAVIPLQRL